MAHLRSRLLHSTLAWALLFQSSVGQPFTKADHRTSEPVLGVAGLRIEYQANPLGIDAQAPRFTWQLRSTARGVMQTAYQVVVARSETQLRKG